MLTLNLVHNRKKNLSHEDSKIEAHNRKITELLLKSERLYEEVKRLFDLAYPSISASAPAPARVAAYQKAQARYEKARAAFRAQAEVGEGLIGSGSGRVLIKLPPR